MKISLSLPRTAAMVIAAYALLSAAAQAAAGSGSANSEQASTCLAAVQAQDSALNKHAAGQADMDGMRTACRLANGSVSQGLFMGADGANGTPGKTIWHDAADTAQDESLRRRTSSFGTAGLSDASATAQHSGIVAAPVSWPQAQQQPFQQDAYRRENTNAAPAYNQGGDRYTGEQFVAGRDRQQQPVSDSEGMGLNGITQSSVAGTREVVVPPVLSIPVTTVPEPATYGMLLAGLALIVTWYRKRNAA